LIRRNSTRGLERENLAKTETPTKDRNKKTFLLAAPLAIPPIKTNRDEKNPSHVFYICQQGPLRKEMNPTLMRKWGVITEEKLNGVEKKHPEQEESHSIMDKIPSLNPNL